MERARVRTRRGEDGVSGFNRVQGLPPLTCPNRPCGGTECGSATDAEGSWRRDAESQLRRCLERSAGCASARDASNEVVVARLPA